MDNDSDTVSHDEVGCVCVSAGEPHMDGRGRECVGSAWGIGTGEEWDGWNGRVWKKGRREK